MSGDRIPFGPGVVILGGGAVLLSLVLVLGFFLPTDWQAEATAVLPASPESVYAYLDSPEGWKAWTPWPDSGLVRGGPERGRGSRISWDDRELGSGSFQIVTSDPGRSVEYAVEVGEGAMRTEGTITLSVEGEGTRATWSEEGNLGRNPLMGFWAFFMDRAQTRELEKSLAQLTELLASTTNADAPADSVSTGAR